MNNNLIEGKRQFEQFEKEQKRYIVALIKEFAEKSRAMNKQLSGQMFIQKLSTLADELDKRWQDYAKKRTLETGIPVFADAFQKNLMNEVTRLTNEAQRTTHKHHLRISTNDAADDRIGEEGGNEKNNTIQLYPSGTGLSEKQPAD